MNVNELLYNNQTEINTLQLFCFCYVIHFVLLYVVRGFLCLILCIQQHLPTASLNKFDASPRPIQNIVKQLK